MPAVRKPGVFRDAYDLFKNKRTKKTQVRETQCDEAGCSEIGRSGIGYLIKREIQICVARDGDCAVGIKKDTS